MNDIDVVFEAITSLVGKDLYVTDDTETKGLPIASNNRLMEALENCRWPSKKAFLFGCKSRISFFAACDRLGTWEHMKKSRPLESLKGCRSASEMLLKMTALGLLEEK